MTRIQTNRLLILFFLIGVIGVSCSKDPLITKPKHFGLQEMLDRGNILDLAVSNTSVTMFNDNGELILFDRKDSSFTFYNDINSKLNTSGIIGIQSLNDSTIVVGDNQHGLRHIGKNNVFSFLSTRGLRAFNMQNQTTFINFLPTLLTDGIQLRISASEVGSVNEFTCIAANNDTLYTGTKQHGVFRHFRIGTTSQLYPERNILAIDNQFIGSCIQMTFDSKGNLWTLTSKGLLKHIGKKSEFIPFAENEIGKHITIHNDTVYLVTNTGISWVDDNKIVEYPSLKNMFEPNEINVMEIDSKGSFWVGTTTGLYKFSN